MEGPAFAQLDLRWSKEFRLTTPKKNEQGKSLTVGIDAFNAVNHVNYVSYVGVETSPFFGHPTSADPMRQLQFSLSYQF